MCPSSSRAQGTAPTMTEMGPRQTGQIHMDFHFQEEDADMSLVLQPLLQIVTAAVTVFLAVLLLSVT